MVPRCSKSLWFSSTGQQPTVENPAMRHPRPRVHGTVIWERVDQILQLSQDQPWYLWYLIIIWISSTAWYRGLTKSCLSHSFRFPRLWTQHQEVMPKSCLWAFPHSERKRQNNPFQIRAFHFHPCFSSLCLRFTVSFLPTFFPKQVYLYGVLSKNSVNRYWVAMALSHRKRPMQFVSSYSFEKVAVLGRIILLLPPGLHSWHARPTTVWLLWAAWVYNVIHLSPTCLHWCPTCLLLTCMSHDVPDVPQQHPPLGFLPDFLPSFLASLLPCFLASFLPSFLSFPFLPSFLPSCPFLPLPSFLPFSFVFFDPCLFFWALFVFFGSLFPHLPGEGC